MQLLDNFHHRRVPLCLAVCTGVFYFTSFAGFDQHYLAWVCFIPVLWALDDESLTLFEAVSIGWTAGLVAHLGAYTWLIEMLRNFGRLPLPLAIVVHTLFCIGQSSLFAAWALGVHWLANRRGLPLVWAAPVVLVVAEWLYPALFPSYFANSQYRQIILLQACELWGTLGLSFILMLSSSVAYALLSWKVRRRDPFPTAALTIFLALLVGTLLYGLSAVANIDNILAHCGPRITVGIVQVNMGIHEMNDDVVEGLRLHRSQSLEVQAQGAQLIIWPESGYHLPIHSSRTNVKGEVMGDLGTPLLFGGLRYERGPGGEKFYNTAFLADANGKLLGSYDKTYLLAFGEYLPLGNLLPSLYRLVPQITPLTPGRRLAPLTLGGIKLGVLICYEDILPRFVRRVMQGQPHVLVNLSNDVWFGPTREPRMHLALATFRAVEQRRYLVRSTNTGISAIVDPAGRVVAETAVFARANLVGDVVPLKGITVYQRFGDWVGWLCLALIAIWCLI